MTARVAMTLLLLVACLSLYEFIHERCNLSSCCRYVVACFFSAATRTRSGVEWSGSVAAAAAAATGGKCGVPQRNTGGGGGGGGSEEFEGEGGRERVKGFQRNELRACVARPFTAASAAVEAMGKGRRTRHVLLQYCTCARGLHLH